MQESQPLGTGGSTKLSNEPLGEPWVDEGLCVVDADGDGFLLRPRNLSKSDFFWLCSLSSVSGGGDLTSRFGTDMTRELSELRTEYPTHTYRVGQ